jgi:hypothetical protein
MQRLLGLIKAAINAVLGKLKRLAIHIIKHPLGSIWWAVKMYFALMFFSLFVACSFGAFAQTLPYDPTDYRVATLKQKWCSDIVTTQCATTPEKAVDIEANRQILAMTKTTSTTKSTGIKLSLDVQSGVTTASGALSYRLERQELQLNYATNQWEWQPLSPINNVMSIGVHRVTPDSYDCPPDGSDEYNIGPVIVDSQRRCYKPKPLENTCFQDPKYSLASQFHFSQSDAGKGSVCVTADNGDSCPFKELAGGNGIFQPDIENTGLCTDSPSDPTPPPVPPNECTTTGSGFKVCKNDPNEKCTANSTGALTCGSSCGYVNGEFMCFTQKDPIVDPNKPDPDPRPDADDNISDPLKPISDLLKSDFKDVQKGVETRLDGLATDLSNMTKAQEFAANKADKSAGQSNKLLNSINQNTANTVEELKKLGQSGGEVGSIVKPELNDKNDWSTRNFGTVLKEKGDALMAIPIMQSISGFFDVGFSGTCPTYSVNVWVFEININQFCSPEVQALFPYIRAIVLLMCSFFAIRVALL